MKKLSLLLLLVLGFVCSFAAGTDNNQIIDQANKAYKDKDYTKALEYWNRLLQVPASKMMDTVCDAERPDYKKKEFKENKNIATEHKAICESRMKKL